MECLWQFRRQDSDRVRACQHADVVDYPALHVQEISSGKEVIACHGQQKVAAYTGCEKYPRMSSMAAIQVPWAIGTLPEVNGLFRLRGCVRSTLKWFIEIL